MHTESAAVRPQPQPQPLLRCSPPRESPIHPITDQSARGAPGCRTRRRRGRLHLQLRRRSRTRSSSVKHGRRWLRDVAVGHRDDGGGTEALQESTTTEELVESTTIEELESTVRIVSAGVVAEEIVRDFIPGHTLHKKGLQGQKSVGTLVSSQERRALVVPLINR